jgi:uncharacterized surface protein with fasciclin (FAS1) repeats
VDVTTGPVKALSGHELAAVVGTDGITFDDAKVIAPDIVASNGVIHVLDSVIVPKTCTDPATPDEPAVLPATTTAATAVAPEGLKTIVEIAVASGSFTTLVAAVTAAGLVEALSGDGPFTVLGKIFLILLHTVFNIFACYPRDSSYSPSFSIV